MNLIKFPMFVGGRDFLEGKFRGEEAFDRNLTLVQPVSVPTVIGLDFEGISGATATFFQQAVIGFRNHVRSIQPLIYVAIIAGPSMNLLEELDFFLRLSNEAIIGIETYGTKHYYGGLLGTLEPKLREAYDLVVQRGETNALELHQQSENKTVGPTAWNNRLRRLAEKGVVIELPGGRPKRFRLLDEKR